VRRQHNSRGLCTPYTPALQAFIEEIIEEYGFEEACNVTQTRFRTMRFLRYGHARRHKYLNYVTYTVMHRLVVGSGMGDLKDWPWYDERDVPITRIDRRPQGVQGVRQPRF
jgi:hypothetical protein